MKKRGKVKTVITLVMAAGFLVVMAITNGMPLLWQITFAMFYLDTTLVILALAWLFYTNGLITELADSLTTVTEAVIEHHQQNNELIDSVNALLRLNLSTLEIISILGEKVYNDPKDKQEGDLHKSDERDRVHPGNSPGDE